MVSGRMYLKETFMELTEKTKTKMSEVLKKAGVDLSTEAKRQSAG